jgi:hypothetical protein
MQQFEDWVLQQYQKRKEWRDLFAPDVMFHHLPREMQTGIIFLFFKEVFGKINIVIVDITDPLEVDQTIKDVFAEKFMDDKFKEIDNATPDN